jgi:hypothetical protein
LEASLDGHQEFFLSAQPQGVGGEVGRVLQKGDTDLLPLLPVDVDRKPGRLSTWRQVAGRPPDENIVGGSSREALREGRFSLPCQDEVDWGRKDLGQLIGCTESSEGMAMRHPDLPYKRKIIGSLSIWMTEVVVLLV